MAGRMTTDTQNASVPLHEQLGITYRQLDHYIRRGYIRSNQPGSGRDRSLLDGEFDIAMLMARLIRIGFTPAAAAAYARASISRGWNGEISLRNSRLIAIEMFAEEGYPRYPFSHSDNSVSEESDP